MTAQALAALDAMEVTQAIQDLQQSVTLIAGKTTVIRVYVNGASGPVTGVSGTLTVLRTLNGPRVTVTSLVPAPCGQRGSLRS